MTAAQQLAGFDGGDQPLTIDCYCDSQGCPLREVVIRAKDHDGELPSFLEARAGEFRCPTCGEPMICNGALNRVKSRENEDRDARASVNIQMYARDHGVGVPIVVTLDDRLPPTPANWFDQVKV